MTKTVTATQARKNLFQLLREAVAPGSYLRITLTNEQPVIVMSEEEWEGWMETLDVLANPEETEEVRRAIAEHESGNMETVDFADVRKQYEKV